jgi:hypothetical protein
MIKQAEHLTLVARAETLMAQRYFKPMELSMPAKQTGTGTNQGLQTATGVPEHVKPFVQSMSTPCVRLVWSMGKEKQKPTTGTRESGPLRVCMQARTHEHLCALEGGKRLSRTARGTAFTICMPFRVKSALTKLDKECGQ